MKAHTIVCPYALLVGIGLCSCSTDVVSIGEERTSQRLERGSRCAESVELEGDVRIQSQAELDALAGCEQIGGDLSIEIFEGTDLAPLASLRVVGGTLEVGSPPPVPSIPPGVSIEEIERLDAERDALIERQRAIAEAGWLESLRGVEALEQVGALRLLDISAPDLRAFSRLGNVSAHYQQARAGNLGLVRTRHLVDLSGLEGIVGVRSITATQNPALESLDGVALEASLDNINLTGNPRLYDLDALRPIESVDQSITLAGLAVRDLDALANLDDARSKVEILDNPELTDASGLDGLGNTAELTISGNAALPRLPALPNLFTTTRLTIENNPRLESITINSIGLNFPDTTVRGHDLWRIGDWLVIAANERLATISLPNAFPSARFVAFQDNPSLVSIDLGNLERVSEVLSITGNPRLSEVLLGDLENAVAIEVIDNPQLSTATLAAVPTFESTFTGNADTPSP